MYYSCIQLRSASAPWGKYSIINNLQIILRNHVPKEAQCLKKIVMSWAHIRCNKPIPGTNTETNQTQPAWTLNKGGGTFSIHVGWHFLVLLSLLLIRLSDQTAITRSRFISETIQYRPKACWRRSTILYKVCHVNSVDWSTQQLVERTSHTYSSLVRGRWCL